MKILVGLIVVVVALVLAGLVGTLMMRDPGLVVLSYGGHMIETGLWTFLLVFIVGWLAIRFLLSTIGSLLSSGRLLGRWTAKRRLGSAKRQTEQGLLLMAEEEWADARKSLISGAKGASAPLLNFLQAAYASNELGQTARRNELLTKAAAAAPGAQFAVDLACARMQLAGDGSETDQAIETLQNLRSQAPRHQIVAELLARGYEQQGDYSALETQLTGLKRLRKEHPDDVARMEVAIARHKVLGAFAKDGDAAGAVAVWKRQDKDTRLDSGFVQEVATALAAGGAAERAGEVLASALDDRWDPALLTQYANLADVESAQARQAKTWLKSRADDALVQLMAARAEADAGNWQKALEHASRSDELEASAAARVEITRCQQALGSTTEQADTADKSSDEAA